MTENFTFNTDKSRYEYRIGDDTVIANIRKENNTLFIDYVEAPSALRGTGAAGRMMEQLVKIAKEEGLEITPICGYAASWLKRHN
jgi:predicted GNAT family acetyltransferase